VLQAVQSLLTRTLPCVAEKIVKVPDMAESISEGTLKQFSVAVGDYVERDAEIATIETDKIDISVNAPEAGTIKEFLANEEDTVTVGQDLVKMETGGSPGEGKETEAKSEPKEAASSEQSTASQPSGEQEQSKGEGSEKTSKESAPESKETPKEEKSFSSSEPTPTLSPESEQKPSPAAAPKKPEAPKPAPTPKPKAKETESKATESAAPGSRGEHRV